VNPAQVGTKAAANYLLTVAPGETAIIRLRLTNKTQKKNADASSISRKSLPNASARLNEFYETVIPRHLSDDARSVMRQSIAGLLWSKQFYHYVVEQWLNGDPLNPPAPPERRKRRNHQWKHLYNADVISMPDKWEYRGMRPGISRFIACRWPW